MSNIQLPAKTYFERQYYRIIASANKAIDDAIVRGDLKGLELALKDEEILLKKAIQDEAARLDREILRKAGESEALLKGKEVYYPKRDMYFPKDNTTWF